MPCLRRADLLRGQRKGRHNPVVYLLAKCMLSLEDLGWVSDLATQPASRGGSGDCGRATQLSTRAIVEPADNVSPGLVNQ